jgi:hypothetical protein
MNTRSPKFWKELGTKDISEVALSRVIHMDSRCICGSHIKLCYVIRAPAGTKIIGKCCARRLGVALRWATKSDYLLNAYLLSRTPWEQMFVNSLQDKVATWGSKTKVSEKQANILNSILSPLNKQWRWVWER